jgi:hypothetical protein
MCAFKAALNFGKDIIELSVSTLATLVSVQLADLTTFLKRQSDAVSRSVDVRDVGTFVVLEREYREAFWSDRRKALAATTGALQVASRVAAKSWAEWSRERNPSAASIEMKPVSEPVKRDLIAIEQVEPPVTNAAEPTKARGAAADRKIRRGRRSKIETDHAPTKASIGRTRSTATKRSGKTRHPPPVKH